MLKWQLLKIFWHFSFTWIEPRKRVFQQNHFYLLIRSSCGFDSWKNAQNYCYTGTLNCIVLYTDYFKYLFLCSFCLQCVHFFHLVFEEASPFCLALFIPPWSELIFLREFRSVDNRVLYHLTRVQCRSGKSQAISIFVSLCRTKSSQSCKKICKHFWQKKSARSVTVSFSS